MNRAIRWGVFLSLMLVGYAATAQKVRYNYDRAANFSQYKTYRWVEPRMPMRNQLLNQNIKRAIDEQLAAKGLRKVQRDGDLDVGYQTGLRQEKQINGWRMGPRWSGRAMGTISTVHVGTLVVSLYDPAKKQLVWRGVVSKQLHLRSNPNKNYKHLQKALAKLFKKYPPKSKK